MRTFIWEYTQFDITEYHRYWEGAVFVAQADNVDEARQLLKNKLQSDLEAQLKIPFNFILHDTQERVLNIYKDKYKDAVSGIYKHEPSHIISVGMAMCIETNNFR